MIVRRPVNASCNRLVENNKISLEADKGYHTHTGTFKTYFAFAFRVLRLVEIALKNILMDAKITGVCS